MPKSTQKTRITSKVPEAVNKGRKTSELNLTYKFLSLWLKGWGDFCYYNHMKNGDVIYVDRGLYRHYGIYVSSSNHVIHYTGATGPDDFNGIVRETTLNEFLNGSDKFGVCNFPEDPKELSPSLNTKKGGLFRLWQVIKSLRLRNYHLYSGTETVSRARSKLGEGGYNLALNNCEHFAVWCKTGIKDSSQVNHIIDIITYLLS